MSNKTFFPTGPLGQWIKVLMALVYCHGPGNQKMKKFFFSFNLIISDNIIVIMDRQNEKEHDGIYWQDIGE